MSCASLEIMRSLRNNVCSQALYSVWKSSTLLLVARLDCWAKSTSLGWQIKFLSLAKLTLYRTRTWSWYFEFVLWHFSIVGSAASVTSTFGSSVAALIQKYFEITNNKYWLCLILTSVGFCRVEATNLASFLKKLHEWHLRFVRSSLRLLFTMTHYHFTFGPFFRLCGGLWRDVEGCWGDVFYQNNDNIMRFCADWD